MTGILSSVASFASMVTFLRSSATPMSFTVWKRPVWWSSSRKTVSEVSRSPWPPPVTSTLVLGALPGGTWAHDAGGTETTPNDNTRLTACIFFIMILAPYGFSSLQLVSWLSWLLSFALDPHPDVRRTVAKREALGFARPQEPNDVSIHEDDILEIQHDWTPRGFCGKDLGQFAH